MKKIKLFLAPHLELKVSVTDEMIKDFRECRENAFKPDGEQKDCDACSWDNVEIEHTGLCEMVREEQILGENADGTIDGKGV